MLEVLLLLAVILLIGLGGGLLTGLIAYATNAARGRLSSGTADAV